ncbi:anthranilate synthase component I [Gottschalkia acidurici]|nr:anthranilate synthase component I [Gottschalkia acidurici]
MINLSRDQFEGLKASGKVFPVIVDYSGDQTTPINIFYNLDGKYKFLLESAGTGEKQGRYSFLGQDPITTIKSDKTNIIVSSSDGEKSNQGNILNFIKDYLKVDYEDCNSEIPFVGGLVGYIGYDVIRQIEDIDDNNSREINVPETYLLKYKIVICYDHLKRNISIIYNVYPEDSKNYEEILRGIEETYENITKLQEARKLEIVGKEKSFKSNFTKKEFCSAVDKVRDYIKSGEASQIVISQRFTIDSNSEPFDVYRRLRSLNPSPYLFYIDYEDFQVVGASPESLVSLSGDKVITNPIAGTRKRGKTREEDIALREELINDPKEKSEHDMLVELGKEDLATVSKEGSIEVERYMEIENYSHVMHLVATVSGKLKEGLDSVDAFKSCFPAGTVSGSPRRRSMEIIEELENVKREIYSGAVGYFSLNGDMDFCIGIRSIVFKDNKAYIQAGAGIVLDSKPENEYEETINKAKALIEVI